MKATEIAIELGEVKNELQRTKKNIKKLIKIIAKRGESTVISKQFVVGYLESTLND